MLQLHPLIMNARAVCAIIQRISLFFKKKKINKEIPLVCTLFFRKTRLDDVIDFHQRSWSNLGGRGVGNLNPITDRSDQRAFLIINGKQLWTRKRGKGDWIGKENGTSCNRLFGIVCSVRIVSSSTARWAALRAREPGTAVATQNAQKVLCWLHNFQ